MLFPDKTEKIESLSGKRIAKALGACEIYLVAPNGTNPIYKRSRRREGEIDRTIDDIFQGSERLSSYVLIEPDFGIGPENFPLDPEYSRLLLTFHTELISYGSLDMETLEALNEELRLYRTEQTHERKIQIVRKYNKIKPNSFLRFFLSRHRISRR